MTREPFFDNMHVDACRRCRKFFFRGDMIEASKVKVHGVKPNPRARGRYCRECAFIRNGETQGVLGTF